MSYETMIRAAASELEAALRSGRDVSSVTVWAIPTTAERDGRLVVDRTVVTNLPAGVWPVVVWPSDNGASCHRSWRVVPYADLYHVLWHACRRQPILPLERPARPARAA